MTKVSPRHAMAGDVVTFFGQNLGHSVVDYRMIYVGVGRPPQGGNINDGSSASTTTHAACRADDLNLAVNPDSGEVDSFSLPIMVEDAIIGTLAHFYVAKALARSGHDSPIKEDQVNCYLGDFAAGSYNITAFMGTSVRTALGGLTAIYATNVSRDAYGEYYTIQYFPHVDKVFPSFGSVAGGTLLKITGGGFSDNLDEVHVTIRGVECKVESSTLVEITCRTGNYTKVYLAEDFVPEFEASDPSVNNDTIGWTLGDEDAVNVQGRWSRVKSDYAGHSGGYLEAPGCHVPPCGSSWVVLAPENVSFDGAYAFWLEVPANVDGAGASCDFGQGIARNIVVLVADAMRGYVPINVSLANAVEKGNSTIFLGKFMVSAGKFDGRRGAVIVDTMGAEGCIVVDGATARRVGPISGGNCSDPLAENFDHTATGTEDCLYLGGRGMLQKTWSLLAPKYRDKTWFKNVEKLNAYASVLSDGSIKRCDAPNNESLYNSSNGETYDSKCGDREYCCLTNDFYGCDAVWDSADEDGWVDVLRQDTKQGRLFQVDEWRRNAHDRNHENYAILDEIEEVRINPRACGEDQSRVADAPVRRRPYVMYTRWLVEILHSGIEFKLDWPGTTYEYMHFAQQMNPTQFNAYTKSEQYNEELGLKEEYVPYYSFDYWGA